MNNVLLEELNLPNAIRLSLQLNNVLFLSELMQTSDRSLLDFGNIGPVGLKKIYELKKRVMEDPDQSWKDCPGRPDSIHSREDILVQHIAWPQTVFGKIRQVKYQAKDGTWKDDITAEEAGLSNRAVNRLHQNGVRTLAQAANTEYYRFLVYAAATSPVHKEIMECLRARAKIILEGDTNPEPELESMKSKALAA